MSNYKLNEEKMFADITDGIAIIINSETGIYYGLNALGTSVYENLINGASTQDILKALKSLNGVPADIEVKFNNYIDKMLKYDLLIKDDDNSAEADIDLVIAQEDNFEFVCQEYNDAQELLLADPIHEVKEETGWTPEKDSIGYTKEETAKREEKVKDE